MEPLTFPEESLWIVNHRYPDLSTEFTKKKEAKKKERQHYDGTSSSFFNTQSQRLKSTPKEN
jgi:hypothetical protein